MTDMGIEFSGTILRLIHPQENGFVRYKDNEGHMNSVYFRNHVRFYKKGRGNLWQIGDEVSFVIEDGSARKKVAKIIAFKGNEASDSFYSSLNKGTQHIVTGFLEIYQDDLFLHNSQYNLLFSVLKTTPSDIHINANKEYEAILDLRISNRSVTLVEWINLHEKVKLYRQTSQTLKVIISEVRDNYLRFPIAGTDFYGMIIGFDRSKGYEQGDEIEVRCYTNKSLKLSFAAVDYRNVDCDKLYLPQLETPYRAVVTGQRHMGYNVEILGDGGLGIIAFRHNEFESYAINDIIEVYYSGRKDSSRRYIFLTKKQYSCQQTDKKNELRSITYDN